jgi:hypothetical protein
MMRTALLLSLSAIVSAERATSNIFSQGAWVEERNIEGEGHKESTRAKIPIKAGATCDTSTTYSRAEQPVVTQLAITGIDGLSSQAIADAGWSSTGSFLPYMKNQGTDALPGVCHPKGGAARENAIACGIIAANEKCSPAPCKGPAAKVGDPCCLLTDYIKGIKTLTPGVSGKLTKPNEEMVINVGSNRRNVASYITVRIGDMCRMGGKGSLCGPWQSTQGYDKGDENSGLCEESIFDIPILLFFAICAVALVIIFFQCSIMGVFDLLCVKKGDEHEEDEKRP